MMYARLKQLIVEHARGFFEAILDLDGEIKYRPAEPIPVYRREYKD